MLDKCGYITKNNKELLIADSQIEKKTNRGKKHDLLENELTCISPPMLTDLILHPAFLNKDGAVCVT